MEAYEQQLVTLGKVLAEEQRRGCDNRAVLGGIELFLDTWKREAEQAGHAVADVQQILVLLGGYAYFSQEEREQRLGQVLERLRAVYRETRVQESRGQESGVRSHQGSGVRGQGRRRSKQAGSKNRRSLGQPQRKESTNFCHCHWIHPSSRCRG